jgi:hypothetical protein
VTLTPNGDEDLDLSSLRVGQHVETTGDPRTL